MDVGEDADVDDHAGETQEPKAFVEGLDVAELELVFFSQDSFILFSNHLIFFDIQPAYTTFKHANLTQKQSAQEGENAHAQPNQQRNPQVRSMILIINLRNHDAIDH